MTQEQKQILQFFTGFAFFIVIVPLLAWLIIEVALPLSVYVLFIIFFLVIPSMIDPALRTDLKTLFKSFIYQFKKFDVDDLTPKPKRTASGSKKSDYDYQANLNKQKQYYDAEIKSYSKEQNTSPLPRFTIKDSKPVDSRFSSKSKPFHPSTHVIIKDGETVDPKQDKPTKSLQQSQYKPKQNDLYDYWKSRSKQNKGYLSSQSSARNSKPIDRIKALHDDLKVKQKSSTQSRTSTHPTDARSRLKKMRDNIVQSKTNYQKTTVGFNKDDACSISPDITEQNHYWNYSPNTVELTSKQKGDMFEHYVIHKFDRRYFSLVEMRSDKGSNGIYPESNQYPDQIWRYKPDSFEFAVECKWRSGWWLRDDKRHWIDLMGGDHKLAVYNRFAQQKGMSVSIALGVGGQPDNPIELYIIPLSDVQSCYAEYTYLQQFRHHDISQNFYLDTYSRTLR